MIERAVSRREAGLRLVAGAAALAAAPVLGAPLGKDKDKKPTASPGTAPAPSAGAPGPLAGPGVPIALAGLIKRGRTKDWILRCTLSVRDGLAGTPNPVVNPAVRPLKFDTASILFPVLANSSSHETTVEAVTSVLRLDTREQKLTPEFSDKYPCGARYGRWTLKDVETRAIELEVGLPLTTWETVFDEALALKAAWPPGNSYPALPASALAEQKYCDPKHASVAAMVRDWTEGKPAQAIPPVALAKFFASKVMQGFRVNGSGRRGDLSGQFIGLELREVQETIATGQGNEHEIACVLAAAYRAAGLPARIVIGYDLSKTKGSSAPFPRGGSSGSNVRSWVEFCLMDMTTKEPTPVWVPVDAVRQKGSGSNPPGLDKPWKFFGGIRETEVVLPLAFHYHPPAGVIAHGFPMFWGWITTPELQAADQSLRFDTGSAPRINNQPIFKQPQKK